MTLIRPPHDQFQDDCQNWLYDFCMYHPPSIYKISCPLIVSRQESAFEQESTLPPATPVASIQNKANFPFQQSCLFVGFWVDQTLLLVIVLIVYMDSFFFYIKIDMLSLKLVLISVRQKHEHS